MHEKNSNPLYKYNHLITGLRQKILNNEFGLKGKLPTERALCDIYSVSRATVRTAMNQLEEEGLVKRQQGRGTFANRAIAGEKLIASPRKEPFHVKFMVRFDSDDIEVDPYFGQIILGFHQFKSEKYQFFITNVNIGLNSRIDEYLDNKPVELYNCQGLVISGPISEEEANFLEKHNINYVLLGQLSSYRSVPCVDIDNYSGFYQATRHLLDKGYQNIVLFYYYINEINREERFNGYKRALNEAGRNVDDKLVHIVDGRKSIDAENKLLELIDRGIDFDAVLVNGDWGTLGVFNALTKKNKRVPDDVGVLGYGVFNWTLVGITPTPTAVAQPFVKAGEKALEILSSKEVDVIQKAIIIPHVTPGKST